ncbi:MAG: hypothetical protein H0U70_11630 [Tatlockia sp.]|nr:hypothetical protein [Tatlockia sp.]
MIYDLKQVAGYAQMVFQMSFNENDKSIKLKKKCKRNWQALKENLRAKAEKFSEDPSAANLKIYAENLYQLALFTLPADQSQQLNSEKNEFIAQHLKGLENALRKVFPEAKCKAPQPFEATPSLTQEKKFFSPSRFQVVRKYEPNEFQQKLIASQPFKDLEIYLKDNLIKDTRSHSFFFCCYDFTENRKAGILQNLINELKNQSNLEQVKDVLAKFYLGKGAVVYRSGLMEKSRFDILNTGQNFFTRITGRDTGSISSINAFAQSVGFDLANPTAIRKITFSNPSPSPNYRSSFTMLK